MAVLVDLETGSHEDAQINWGREMSALHVDHGVGDWLKTEALLQQVQDLDLYLMEFKCDIVEAHLARMPRRLAPPHDARCGCISDASRKWPR